MISIQTPIYRENDPHATFYIDLSKNSQDYCDDPPYFINFGFYGDLASDNILSRHYDKDIAYITYEFYIEKLKQFANSRFLGKLTFAEYLKIENSLNTRKPAQN